MRICLDILNVSVISMRVFFFWMRCWRRCNIDFLSDACSLIHLLPQWSKITTSLLSQASKTAQAKTLHYPRQNPNGGWHCECSCVNRWSVQRNNLILQNSEVRNQCKFLFFVTYLKDGCAQIDCGYWWTFALGSISLLSPFICFFQTWLSTEIGCPKR